MNELEKRYSKLFGFIIIVCIIFIGRLLFLNVVKGEEYTKLAENSIYKKIINPAPRGEIRDRNGILLAGNRPIFVVQISKNTKTSLKERNESALRIYNILKEGNEAIIDEFPIILEGDNYKFSFDEDIKKFKRDYNIPEDYDAKQSLIMIADIASADDLNKIDTTKPLSEVQKKINENGYYPPISVGEEVEFTRELEKRQWLYGYGISDNDISAEDAFFEIIESQDIDEELSPADARKILVISDAIKSKGYLQYEPVTIAKDISQKTVAKINENVVQLSGVSIQVQPQRYYPQGSLSSHILGQIGKISDSDNLLEDKEKYGKNDIVGKAGIEKSFESYLKGANGYEEVQTDASGKKISEIGSKDPVPGSTVYSSIDAKLQKVAEDALEKSLTAIRTGGTFNSEYGNYKINSPHPEAKSGAIVVLDVNTGKVLAMASYPGYDPNIFTAGLTKEQYESLQPENPNDPLSPKPQFNIATMTTVQPGSIFKMITGLAALEEGLDSNYVIEDKGVIEIGGQKFGTFAWNQYRQLQGMQDMISAIKVSNNYYFYCISVGYNFAKEEKIPGLGNMNEKQIIEMSKKFGLDQKTGIEIFEVKGSVPDKESKYQVTKQALRRDITSKMENSFIDINSDNEIYPQRIEEIVGWIDENPPRAEIINRLRKLNVRSESLEPVADLVKYTYYNSATWKTGDIFNISIGQGANSYTPLQIANYVSAIANGGKLNKVSIIDKIVDNQTGTEYIVEPESSQISLKNTNNLSPLREGMLQVSKAGSARELFANFPIDVASKTGTAEKEGYIPTIDEKQYLLRHLGDYAVNRQEVLNLAKKYQKEDNGRYEEHIYIRSAILNLNKRLNHDRIDRFKQKYDSFAWFVAFAPYDKPEIAVVTLLFQAGSGTFAGIPSREVIGYYMGISNRQVQLKDENKNTSIILEHGKENTEKKYVDNTVVEPLETQNIYQESPSQPPVINQSPIQTQQQAPEEVENNQQNISEENIDAILEETDKQIEEVAPNETPIFESPSDGENENVQLPQ